MRLPPIQTTLNEATAIHPAAGARVDPVQMPDQPPSVLEGSEKVPIAPSISHSYPTRACPKADMEVLGRMPERLVHDFPRAGLTRTDGRSSGSPMHSPPSSSISKLFPSLPKQPQPCQNTISTDGAHSPKKTPKTPTALSPHDGEESTLQNRPSPQKSANKLLPPPQSQTNPTLDPCSRRSTTFQCPRPRDSYCPR